MRNNILVLAAHPDDEVLGCGGTIAKYASQGDFVHVAFISDGVFSRQGDENALAKELESRRSAAHSALSILGVTSISFGEFPDNRLDTVATIEVAQMIEALITEYQPKVVFTHHYGDVNVDHKMVHEATVVACRPQPNFCVKSILCYEVPSSTEWQLSGKRQEFCPNHFVDISSFLDQKIRSLSHYEFEMRASPHPRSLEAVRHLAHWRGAIVGVDSAEAFMVGRIIE
jgi:LmbE family N-acetylglucosaminyl deacetylase